MDHRILYAIKQHWVDPIVSKFGSTLDSVQSGGTTATNLDSIQAKLDATLGEIQSGGNVAGNLNTIQTQLDLIIRLLANRPLAAAGLTIDGVDAAKFKGAVTLAYVNQFLFKSKDLTGGFAFTAVTPVLNSGADTAEKCRWLVSLQADGTVVTTAGAVVAAASAAVLPACPANETPIGYIEVETDAGTTFTPNTTELSAAGITATFVDSVWPHEGADVVAALGALTHSAVADLGALTHESLADLATLPENIMG